MTDRSVAVTVGNHVGLAIGCPAVEVWDAILRDYVDGRKFETLGYDIEPLTDDVAAFLGGYRMAFGPDREDERVFRVTERGEAEMRLSVSAHYLSEAANGMVVHATYRARPCVGGARFEIDSYAHFLQSAPRDAQQKDIGAFVSDLTVRFAAAMNDYLATVKADLERIQPA